MKIRNVISLFDGYSGAQFALREAKVKYNRYYASEIDKPAITVTQNNFPDTIQLGDVTKWREWELDWSKIDLVVGGSPCQGFSFAGKKLAFDDPRSKLFFEFVNVLKQARKHNPKVLFFLENVYMKKEHENVITQTLEIGPLKINSARVSAQNRKRNYWTNIYSKPDGMFGDIKCCIPQPEDRKLYIQDIEVPDEEVPAKYYLKPSVVRKLLEHARRHKMKGNGFGAKFHHIYEKMSTLKVGGTGEDDVIQLNPAKETNNNTQPYQQNRFYSIEGKSPCLDQDGRKLILTHHLQQRLTKGVGGKGYLSKIDQKAFCLDTSNSQAIERIKGVTITPRGLRPHKGDKKKTGISELGTITFVNQKGDALTTTHDPKIIKGNVLRRLTPVERERLQGLPDNSTAGVSDTQRVKMTGNGFNVPTVAYIFSFIGKIPP